MEAIIKKVYKKSFATASGKQFDRLFIDCDCIIDDKGTIRTYKASFAPDYAKKYFRDFCGFSSKELVGKKCTVNLRRRAYTTKDGKDGTVTEVYRLYLNGEDGNPMYMPYDKAEEAELF